MLHFEYHRSRQGEPSLAVAQGGEKDKHKGKKIVGYWEDGLAIYEDGSREEKAGDVSEEGRENLEEDGDGFWEESFGGHRDSKPFGPASVGVDVSFPGSQHLYGLPEHASSMVLQTTKGEGAHYKEPYRMYTLDVFEYELDEPMALYGGIPVVLSHTATATVGCFWFNPTETFVDVEKGAAALLPPAKFAERSSESGLIAWWCSPSKRIALTTLLSCTCIPPLFGFSALLRLFTRSRSCPASATRPQRRQK